MTTLPTNVKHTLKSIKRSINIISESISSTQEKLENLNPCPKLRWRKPLLGLFETSPPLVHAFGILGMVGPLDMPDSGWMTTDYAAWVFLITHMKGYARERSTWLTIRPVDHLFPERVVTFGEARCDRLCLPLPSTLETYPASEITAGEFKSRCLISLGKVAQNVKPGEKLVLLLVGHGGVDNTGRFQFLITTQIMGTAGEDFITKGELEFALQDCKGDILVICNSCYSGNLASDHWTLLCSATSEQMADGLSQSQSGYFRGSTFTACVVAQAAREHGLQVPLPRVEPRPTDSGDDPIRLPFSPPPHTFSNPEAAKLAIIKPLNISLEEFVNRMMSMKQFLVENSVNIFEATGSQSTVSWTSILPVDFTAKVVAKIGVSAEQGATTNYNVICSGGGPQGGPFHTAVPQSPKMGPLLVKLVTAMPEIVIGPGPRTHEALYRKLCIDLSRHIADPEQYASPLQIETINEEGLLATLHSMHIQTVAAQHIARELGWCDPADRVVPFFQMRSANGDFQGMIRHGFLVDKLSWHLKMHHFHRLRAGIDRTSAGWLAVQWAKAGRPVIPRPEWDKLEEKVGMITKREAMQ